MSEGPGGPQGATAGGTLAMRMLSQQAMVASQMKRAANDKAIAQMLAAKKSGPPAARLGDEIQHKSFLGALAGAVLGAIVTIAEGCLIMAACATGPYALVLVPALMYASYKASDYVEEKQNQLESWINSFCDTDGAINTGSENVNINGKPAARAAVTLPPPPPPGAIPEIPQGEPSWGDIATDLLESAAEKAVPLAKAWGNAVITLTESNAGFMDRVSAGASLLFPAGPVLMEFATMVGGRGEIKKDVDFPEAGEDTALCDKENKPPRIAQGSSNVFINNQPAARKGDKLECSAAIVEGSPDVFIGGEQVTYLDIQIGDLLTPNKDVRRTFHDRRTALQFVALARGRLIVDKDVATALGYPRWFVLLVAERRVLTGFREIHIFFDFATPAHHGGKLH